MANTILSPSCSLYTPNSSRKFIDEIPADKRDKLCTEIDYTIHLNQGYWKKLVSGLGYDETQSKKFRLSFEMHESPTDNLLRDCSYRMLRIRHLYHVLMDIGLVQLAKDVLDDFDTEEELPYVAQSSLMVAYPPRSTPSHFDHVAEKKNNKGNSGEWHGLNTKHFSYEEIKVGTKGFDYSMELGAGAFGKVYKVILNNTMFACKVLKIDKENPLTTSIIETHRQHDDLRNELNYLAEYRHPNVIALYGWSLDGPDPCLIYDYMENGSLQDRLQCLNGSLPMEWDKRIKVSCGAARGLQFLHTNNKKPLIHGDIKTANILLDESFTAKLGDFGLAREMPRNASTGSYIQLRNEHTPGTLGYLANEYITTKKLSVQVDTYAFGVVLLELYTGRRAYDRSKEKTLLRDYMDDVASEAEKIGEAAAEEKLYQLQDSQIKWLDRGLALRYVRLALKCCHEKRNKRPKMADTLAELEDIDQALAKGSRRSRNLVVVDKPKPCPIGCGDDLRKGTNRRPVESIDHHSLRPDMTLDNVDSPAQAKMQECFVRMSVRPSSGDESDSAGMSSEPTTYSDTYSIPPTHQPPIRPACYAPGYHQTTHEYASTISSEGTPNNVDLYNPGPYNPPGGGYSASQYPMAPGSRVSKTNPYGLDLDKAFRQIPAQPGPSSSSRWHGNMQQTPPCSYNNSIDYAAQPRQSRKDLTLPTSNVYKGGAGDDDASSGEPTYPRPLSFQFPSPVSINPVKESLIEQLEEGKSYTEIFNDSSSRTPIESSMEETTT